MSSLLFQDWVNGLPLKAQIPFFEALPRGAASGLTAYEHVVYIVNKCRYAALTLDAQRIVGGCDCSLVYVKTDLTEYNRCISKLPQRWRFNLNDAAGVTSHQHPDEKVRAEWVLLYDAIKKSSPLSYKSEKPEEFLKRFGLTV